MFSSRCLGRATRSASWSIRAVPRPLGEGVFKVLEVTLNGIGKVLEVTLNGIGKVLRLQLSVTGWTLHYTFKE